MTNSTSKKTNVHHTDLPTEESGVFPATAFSLTRETATSNVRSACVAYDTIERGCPLSELPQIFKDEDARLLNVIGLVAYASSLELEPEGEAALLEATKALSDFRGALTYCVKSTLVAAGVIAKDVPKVKAAPQVQPVAPADLAEDEEETQVRPRDRTRCEGGAIAGDIRVSLAWIAAAIAQYEDGEIDEESFTREVKGSLHALSKLSLEVGYVENELARATSEARGRARVKGDK